MKILIGAFISLFLLTGFTSYKGYQKFPEPPPTTDGELIYQEMGCVMCHGHQGMGDGFMAGGLNPKPRNFTSYAEMHRLPYQSMYSAIKNGVPNSGMPSFNLSDRQVDDVISYVRSFLTENYITVNTCINSTQVVSLENVDTDGHFEMEIDKKNVVSASVKGEELTLTPNLIPLMKALRDKRKKMARVHISLTKGADEEKKYLAIVALRIRDCIK